MAGNRIIQLGGAARAIAARVQQTLYPSTPTNGVPGNSGNPMSQQPSIRGIAPNAWPNPLQPVAPFGPAGSRPVQWNFWEGQNLNYTPRPDAEYTAAELRALATYPLARICIDNVKDIVCQTEWSIGLKAIPGETQRERAKRQKGDENIVNLSRFFEYPDQELDWAQWSRILVENLLTIDAAAILVERSKRGRVAILRSILDGGSITRYIDDRGMTPPPPSHAYTQNWFGIPRVDLTTEELLYGVHNIVPRGTISSYLYGMSATEGLAEELKIGIERLKFILAYYSSGSVPDVIQMAPPGIDAAKIEEAMKANNAILSGNLNRRRQWTILQGFQSEGKLDQILFPKQPLLADPFDDMHIKKIAYGYGDAPQRLTKQLNRASSESNQTAAEEEGITPWVIWLQGLMNRIIQSPLYMDMPDYGITFKQERESDVIKLMQADTGYVKNGMYSINERRELRGDDPRPEPQADELGIITANGWLELGAIFQQTPDGPPNAKPGSGGDHGSSQSPVGPPGEKVLRMIEKWRP